MEPIHVPLSVARRFILGKHGLWPGRRWQGLEGTEAAMRAIEDLQLDPLVLVARAQDIVLHARVIDYRPDDWATLTYGQRKFFDWGGWLAVRPIEELPHWRVVMRRELERPNWIAFQREHGPAIAEMRAALRDRGLVSNRDFASRARTRTNSYWGRKDSSLALHFLWRIGDVMVSRRDNFERVYALTEAVAPRDLIRESDPAAAEDYLLMKVVAADGLHPMRSVGTWLRRTVPAAELAAWRARKIDEGRLVEVRVEGWRAPQVALASDMPLLEDLLADRTPTAWAPLDTTTEQEATFLAPLEPVSARGRAKALFGFEYVWEIYKPADERTYGPYTLPVLWGERLVARFDARMDRSTATLVINGFWPEEGGLAKDDRFVEAMGRGMDRFLRFLGAGAVDVRAVKAPSVRARLRRSGP